LLQKSFVKPRHSYLSGQNNILTLQVPELNLRHVTLQLPGLVIPLIPHREIFVSDNLRRFLFLIY
jgi:hypothetical protein